MLCVQPLSPHDACCLTPVVDTQVDGLTAAGYSFTESDTGSVHVNGSISLQDITFNSPEVSPRASQRLPRKLGRHVRFDDSRSAVLCRQRSGDLEATTGQSRSTSPVPRCQMQVFLCTASQALSVHICSLLEACAPSEPVCCAALVSSGCSDANGQQVSGAGRSRLALEKSL